MNWDRLSIEYNATNCIDRIDIKRSYKYDKPHFLISMLEYPKFRCTKTYCTMVNYREGKKKGEDLTVKTGASPIDNGLYQGKTSMGSGTTMADYRTPAIVPLGNQ